MVDGHAPEVKQVRVLAGQTLGETRRRRDLEIVQDDDRARRRIMQCQEKCMLALGGIGRAVDENQPGPPEALERFSLRGEVERLDRAKTIPAARQRNDLGVIGGAFRDRSFELFRAAQPIGGILDAGRGGRSAAQGVGRAAGTEFKSAALVRQERGDFLEKLAAQRRKNPGGSFGRRLAALILPDEAFQLIFERSVSLSGI